jgi:eukaryotic-like serine/threonine-protein kinase
MLWVRSMDAVQARVLSGTEGATFPFWAQDGRSLGFFADGKLKVVELNGGPPLVVTDG